LIVALLVFGPKRLPEMGRSLGNGMREFKDSVSGKEDRRDAPAEKPFGAEGLLLVISGGTNATRTECP
jgi:TatA/E family protein of Tat protein translocase